MNKLLKFIAAIFFSFSFCLACVGYAAISDNLYIGGTVDATPQEGVYITDYRYVSNNGAIVGSSEITYAYQTMLNSTITLSQSNKNSSITYEITIYNSNDFDTAFNGVKYLKYDGTIGTYSNDYITYSLSGLNERQILKSKQYVTFQITFSYKNNWNSNYSNVLESVINFQYPRIYYVTYENFVSTAGYPGIAFVEQDLTVSLGSITEPVQVTKKSSGTILIEETKDDTITVSKSNINDNIHIRRMRECHVVNKLDNPGFDLGNHNYWGGSGTSALNFNVIEKTGSRNGTHRIRRDPDPGNTSHASGWHYLWQNQAFKAGHKYYFFGYAMTSGSVQTFSANIQGIGDAAFSIRVDGSGWKKGDVVFTAPNTATHKVAINTAYISASVYADSYGLMDLTEAFGAGTEPSYAWCHDHLGYYELNLAYDIKYI